MTGIQTFVINLKERKDRKENILKEFSIRKEFVVQVVEAIKHKVGGVGLWKTIRHIVRDLADPASDFILICEDDHQFTGNYSSQHLFAAITEAIEKKADILSGGVSWVQTIFRISSSLYWVDKFTGTQFIIIFKQLYPKILNSKFKEHDSADLKLCSLSKNKLVVFPFISIQKDFGYSDATKFNNEKGRVSKLFKNSVETFDILNSVTKYYQEAPRFNGSFKGMVNLTVPTYIINLPERVERLKHIKKQFQNKPEFDIKIVEACKNRVGALGLWKSIRKVIQMAIANEDDVIVIVEDDHHLM
ncbi:MAG: glycosyl transferase [Bacteroidetes bacterium]|nr:glycosyl transferase [Bacteroidota bacterium]